MTDKPAEQPDSGTAGSGPAVPGAPGAGTGDSAPQAGGRRARRKAAASGLPWARRRPRPAGQHSAHGGTDSAAQPAASGPAPAASGADRAAAAGRDAGNRQAAAGAAGAPAPGSGKAAAAGSRNVLGIAAGIALLAVAGTAAAAGSVSGIGSAAAEVPAVAAEVPAGNFTGVCPEPPRLLDSAADETDPQFSPVSESASARARAVVFSDLGGTLPGSSLAELGARKPLVTIAKSAGDSGAEVRGSSEDGQTRLIAGVVPGQALTDPTVLTVEPVAGQQALAGAAMTYRAGDGDLRGLAAANCTAPANDFWLLGAATTVGATAVLDLHNPTRTPSTVDLELVGTEGRIQAAGARGLLLAPGESRSIVLGGLAAGQDSLAVHVSTSGGPVSGTIQQSILRGLTPGGVELLTPTAGASAQQVITGVVVQSGKLSRSVRSQDGYGSAAPALEVVVPGGQDAALQVRVFGKDGEVELPGGRGVTAAAGTVTAVPLDSLPAGTYSVQVSSDVSVVAAARVSRATSKGAPVDFAWAPAAARLGSEHVAVVPGGVGSRLVFGAPAEAAEIKLVPVDGQGGLGKARVVKVPAGTTVSVDPKAGGAGPAAVMVSAAGGAVYGSQVLVASGRPDVSVLPVPAGAQGRQSVPVYLGY